ncbi:hypothetical protein SUN_0403 [Sulfurovum sp. NBC37-1]|nr:hypothetical protein SUN_0403 [Sulfurovum sp. NBC37-1]
MNTVFMEILPFFIVGLFELSLLLLVISFMVEIINLNHSGAGYIDFQGGGEKVFSLL